MHYITLVVDPWIALQHGLIQVHNFKKKNVTYSQFTNFDALPDSFINSFVRVIHIDIYYSTWQRKVRQDEGL
jgi:hypothetical protein